MTAVRRREELKRLVNAQTLLEMDGLWYGDICFVTEVHRSVNAEK
jgi:hypothetical protein